MSATVIPISRHPRYVPMPWGPAYDMDLVKDTRPLDDRSPATKAVDAAFSGVDLTPAAPDLIEEYWKGSAAMAGGHAVPAPPRVPANTHTTPMPEKTYFTCAETAKLIRAALKKAFPGVKFGVVSKTYSGGASITVKIPAGGPAGPEVRKVTDLYSGAGFDGMNDLKFYYSHWLMPDGTVTVAKSTGSGASYEPFSNPAPHPDAKLVHFGADFIFVHRDDGCLA